ncbi:Glycine dehydrogenase (decarboxylating) [Frankliniella fusca]|uniref:Glycine dehydrogenase (Decarboxylating) n=1 Tax=Frankliniella fusca TaxID=407009 RepID=A0AAE1GR03_9NEOP|nr:Glycine dehydrogenase (decarboxylating) [Frankliniella fusca]
MDSKHEPDQANASKSTNIMSWDSFVEELETKCSQLSTDLKAFSNSRFLNQVVVRTLKCQFTSSETEHEQKASSIAEMKGKKLQVDNEFQLQLELTKELESKSEDCEEKRFSMLDEFDDDVEILSKRFLTAPDAYKICKIAGEIDSYMNEILNIEDQINSLYDPEISRLDSLIEEEPVTHIDLQGFLPRNYTASELSIFVSQTQESAKDYKQMNENLKKKMDDLKEKEDSL